MLVSSLIRSRLHGASGRSVRIAAAVLGVALAAALGSETVAAAAPVGVAISPTGPSTLLDRLDVLAGSPSTLVYARSHQLAQGAGGGDAGPGVENGFTATIETRDLGGQTTTIGSYPDSDALWSLSRRMLTADVRDADGHPTRDVDWWDLDSKTHGRIQLAVGHVYVGASPDGVVYTSGTELRIHSVAGIVTSLGSPFATPVLWVASGDAGLVATDGAGGAAYMPFASPGSFTQLATGTTDRVACAVVSTTHAACQSGERDDDNDTGFPALNPARILLLPLDGSPATISTVCPGATALAGDAVMWIDGCTADKIYSLGAGDTDPLEATVSIDRRLRSAYGLAVAATPARSFDVPAGQIQDAASSIIGFSDPTHVSTLVDRHASPVSTATFSLTPGRVAWTDDAPTPGEPDTLLRVSSRTLSAGTSVRPLGPTQVIAAHPVPNTIVPALVAASSTAVVYADHYAGQTATLHVVSPYGDAILKNVISYGHVLVSGNRVLFQRLVSSDTHVDVYDLRTHKTTVVRVLHDTVDSTSTTIWGDYMAYATVHGWVYRTNLRTGTTVKLATGNKQHAYGTITVYANGDWVGWHTQLSDGVSVSDINRMRNARTLAPAINLGHTLRGLTSAGALMDGVSTSAPPSDPSAPTRTLLRTYGGSVRTLLSARHYLQHPQLVGGTLAWIGAGGVLRAARVTVPIPRPRSLGNPIAPHSFLATTGARWTLAAPYSLPLTSCTVTLTRNGSVVRTLACSTAARADGLATVTWDGKRSNGTAAPVGTYTWTIHARGTTGGALSPGGTTTPAHGTVILNR